MATLGTVDLVFRFIDRFSKGYNQAAKTMTAGNAQISKASIALAGLKSVMVGGSISYAYAAIDEVVKSLYAFGQEAALAERSAKAFGIAFEAIGENSAEALGKLHAASRNTVSDVELMTSASKALSLGVATSSAEIAKLIEVATVLGRRTGLGTEQSIEKLFIGIGRLSPRILDDLGIAVNLTRLFREETGKASTELEQSEKIHILLNKVLQDGNVLLEQYGGNLDDTASKYERLTAAWINYKNELGQTAVFGAVAEALDQTAQSMFINRVVRDFNEGKASITDVTSALKLLNLQLEDIDPKSDSWLGLSGGTQISIVDAQIQDLTKAYKELIAARKSEETGPIGVEKFEKIDYSAQYDQAAQEILKLSGLYDQYKKDVIAAHEETSQGARYAAELSVRGWEEAAKHWVDVYNEAAAQMQLEPIDAKVFEDSGVIQKVVENMSVFDLALKQQQEEADKAAEANKRLQATLAELAKGYNEAAIAGSQEISRKSVSLEIEDVSPGAQQAARQAEEYYKIQLYYIEQMVAGGMAERDAIIETGRARAESLAILERYAQAKQDADNTTALEQTKAAGTALLSTLTELTSAQQAFKAANNTESEVEKANALAALQKQVVDLAIAYNVAAEIAGLELIDLDKIRQGELAILDAAGAVDIFQRKLEGQDAAMDAFVSRAEGMRMQVISTISGYSDVMDLGTMNQVFGQATTELQTEIDRISASSMTGEQKLLALAKAEREVMGPIDDTAAAMRNQTSSAEDLAKTIEGKLKSAYDSLTSLVSGELKDSLNELSDIGIDPSKMLPRQDAPAENARRLADIAVNGLKDQPWLEEFKNEVPGIWDELSAAGNMKEAATRMLQEFQQGLRPELIDFTQLKEGIKEKIRLQMRMDDMAQQITNELIVEMGEGNAPEIERFVSEALGQGISDSGFASDTVQSLLDQFASADFQAKIAEAGGNAVDTWYTAFLDKAPDYTAQLVQMLATLVTPAVQASLNAQKNATVPR
jgi:hypothetical protein